MIVSLKGTKDNQKDNQDDYKFWRDTMKMVEDNDNMSLMARDSKFTQYALHYAHKIGIDIGDIHWGVSLKFIESTLLESAYPLIDTPFEEFEVILTDSLSDKQQKNSVKDRSFSGDIGVIFSAKEDPFKVGWSYSNINAPTFGKEDNKSKQVIDEPFVLDAHHILSVAYEQDGVIYTMDLDLFPYQEAISKHKLQYVDIGIAYQVDNTSIIQAGFKTSLRHTPYKKNIYALGFEKTYRKVGFSLGYQFSDYYIDEKSSYKHENRFSISFIL